MYKYLLRESKKNFRSVNSQILLSIQMEKRINNIKSTTDKKIAEYFAPNSNKTPAPINTPVNLTQPIN